MNFFYFIIFLISLASLQNVKSKVIHIDSDGGIDELTCGHLQKPCKNLRFAWNTALLGASNKTATNVTFELHSGVYKPNQKIEQPLFYKCNDGSVYSIEIKRVENRSALSLLAQHLSIQENVNTTLIFDNVNGSVIGASLYKELTDENQPTILTRKSIINFKDVVISCLAKKTLEDSPIVVDKTDTVKCKNCSTTGCKNICGRGLQTVNDVFCEKCPVGTSAHAWEQTCRPCHPGYFASQPGTVDCQPCKKGTFCKDKGCTKCKKCKNELFSSTPGSTSCTQMSLLFIILVGVALLLIMAPIAVKVIKTKRNQVENAAGDDVSGEEKKEEKKNYTKFQNENL